ncbi:MAG: hypothetical protein GX308_01875 [Epulopiscium sp.]|nr:hypothetical protein [Candidatus Epulonipiscium sp.]
MITLNILDVKKTMNELLKGNLFNEFETRSCEIHTITKFNIDGILNKSFISIDEQEPYNRSYVLWEEIKPHIFNIIKGERPPTYFKVIFSAGETIISKFPEDISALFINLIYNQGNFSCTSGIAVKAFTLDKSSEYQWDKYVLSFFKKAGILVE